MTVTAPDAGGSNAPAELRPPRWAGTGRRCGPGRSRADSPRRGVARPRTRSRRGRAGAPPRPDRVRALGCSHHGSAPRGVRRRRCGPPSRALPSVRRSWRRLRRSASRRPESAARRFRSLMTRPFAAVEVGEVGEGRRAPGRVESGSEFGRASPVADSRPRRVRGSRPAPRSTPASTVRGFPSAVVRVRPGTGASLADPVPAVPASSAAPGIGGVPLVAVARARSRALGSAARSPPGPRREGGWTDDDSRRVHVRRRGAPVPPCRRTCHKRKRSTDDRTPRARRRPHRPVTMAFLSSCLPPSVFLTSRTSTSALRASSAAARSSSIGSPCPIHFTRTLRSSVFRGSDSARSWSSCSRRRRRSSSCALSGLLEKPAVAARASSPRSSRLVPRVSKTAAQGERPLHEALVALELFVDPDGHVRPLVFGLSAGAPERASAAGRPMVARSTRCGQVVSRKCRPAGR